MRKANNRMNDGKNLGKHSRVNNIKDKQLLTKNELNNFCDEEFSIIDDNVLDFISNNAKKHIVSEKYKNKEFFLV